MAGIRSSGALVRILVAVGGCFAIAIAIALGRVAVIVFVAVLVASAVEVVVAVTHAVVLVKDPLWQ